MCSAICLLPRKPFSSSSTPHNPPEMVKVKKPKAILLDISSIAVKTYFNEKVLMPYFGVVAKSYLEKNWDESATQDDIERIRNEPLTGDDAPTIPPKDASKAEVVNAVANYINYCTEKRLEPKGYLMFK